MDSIRINIPSKWSSNYLGKLAEFVNGYAFKPSDWGEVGFPIIRIEQLRNEKAKFDSTNKIIPNKYVINDGDLIFSWSATLMLKIWKRGPAYLNQHLFKVINNANIDRIFLKYLIEHNLQLIKIKTHGSTMKHITRGLLLNHKVIFPELIIEQQKIAEILSTIDELIDQTEKIIAKLKRIKAGLMHDLLTKGIDENGNIRSEKTYKFKDSPLGRIPEEWEVKKVADLLDEYINGYAFNSNLYVKDGIPIIRMSNITTEGNFYFNKEDSKYCSIQEYKTLTRFHVGFGDLIMAMTDVTPERALIGRTAIVDINGFFILNQRVGLLKVSNKFDPIYVHYYFNHNVFLRYARSLCTMSAQANLSTEQIKNTLIKIPKAKVEQKSISMKLCAIDEVIHKEEIYKKKLLSLKQGLMNDLLTSKVRVNHLIEKN